MFNIFIFRHIPYRKLKSNDELNLFMRQKYKNLQIYNSEVLRILLENLKK